MINFLFKRRQAETANEEGGRTGTPWIFFVDNNKTIVCNLNRTETVIDGL